MEKPGSFFVECPETLLLAVAGLILLVLRHLHAHTLGKRPDCIRIAQSLDLHLEIDDAAALMAAKAVVNAFIGSNRERSRFLPMEGTQAKEIGTGTLQRHILSDHVFNWIASRQLVKKCRWESHNPPPFYVLNAKCRMQNYFFL